MPWGAVFDYRGGLLKDESLKCRDSTKSMLSVALSKLENIQPS